MNKEEWAVKPARLLYILYIFELKARIFHFTCKV